MVVPLLGLSLFLGLYPKPVLDRIEPVGRSSACTTSSARATTAQPIHPQVAKQIQNSEGRRRGHDTSKEEGGK